MIGSKDQWYYLHVLCIEKMLETFADLDLHLSLTLTYICITEVRLMTLMNLPRAKQREKDCGGRPTTQESGKY